MGVSVRPLVPHPVRLRGRPSPLAPTAGQPRSVQAIPVVAPKRRLLQSANMEPLERYLQDIREVLVSGAGTPETSYYTALENLLSDIGRHLKPRVRCVLQLANRGVGLPDGGLFTQEQFRGAPDEPLLGQLPNRGVIEIKPIGEDAWLTSDGEQVSRYWGRYRQVLVTNLRDFVLVGQDLEGQPTKLETFRLATNEEEFRKLLRHPKGAAKQVGDRLEEYLRRVMLRSTRLSAPEDIASLLASYAKDALARVEGAPALFLTGVRRALENALGMKFEGKDGEHFFRSTLVQTLFYGVFSAWVIWARSRPQGSESKFDWRTASFYLHVPVVRKLFYELADPGSVGALHLHESMDWATDVLNRVDQHGFFDRFEENQAVQYFYEPFLTAFDPVLRKQLGVWYTPREVVEYMVARVDQILRREFHLPDGLADERVYVLDPCCGTGTYLVEALQTIYRTLTKKSADALVANDVREAALTRIFGFEILPAPLVVSHLQIGLLLQMLGAPLSEQAGQRAGVYLTNALTGWETREQPPLEWPELDAERTEATSVKTEKPILVVFGNPPYNAFAGVSPKEEEGLVEPYKGIHWTQTETHSPR